MKVFAGVFFHAVKLPLPGLSSVGVVEVAPASRRTAAWSPASEFIEAYGLPFPSPRCFIVGPTWQ
jgi:hypothetical protein